MIPCPFLEFLLSRFPWHSAENDQRAFRNLFNNTSRLWGRLPDYPWKHLHMYKRYAFLIGLLSLASGCSKTGVGSSNNGGTGNNPGGSSGATNRVKIVTLVPATRDGNGNIDTVFIHYTWNAQNQCTEVLENQDTTYYTYTASTLTSQQGAAMITYRLNASGATDSAIETYNFLGFITTTLYRYTYDAGGYISTMKYYAVTARGDSLEGGFNYAVSGGNVTGATDINTQILYSYTYTSATTTTAPLPPDPLFGPLIDVTDPQGSGNLFGTPDANLLGSIPGLSFTTSLDAQKRITKVLESTVPTDTLYATAYYTYY